MNSEQLQITKDTKLDINFARQLLDHLGEDTSPIQDYWCWCDLYKHYGNDVRTKVETFFSEHPHGEAAYNMVHYCDSSYKWAEPIIESANNGRAAYRMVHYCDSSREWAERVIENAQDGYSAF